MDFVAHLKAQTDLYRNLLERVVKIKNALAAGVEPNTLLRMFEERETALEKIKPGDAVISKTLAGTGGAKLRAEKRVAEPLAELSAVIAKIMALDEQIAESLKSSMKEVQEEMNTLAGGRRKMSAYGKMGKQEFARYIDRKY